MVRSRINTAKCRGEICPVKAIKKNFINKTIFVICLVLGALPLVTAKVEAAPACSDKKVVASVSKLIRDYMIVPYIAIDAACHRPGVSDYRECAVSAENRVPAVQRGVGESGISNVTHSLPDTTLSISDIRTQDATDRATFCAANLRIVSPYLPFDEYLRRFGMTADEYRKGYPPFPTGNTVIQRPFRYKIEVTDDGKNYYTISDLPN